MASDKQSARDAASQSRGFASYYYERKAKAQQRGYAGYREQRVARTGKAPLKGGDRPGRVSRPPRVQVNPSGMTVITSRDWRYLNKALNNHAGSSCAVRLTINAAGKFKTLDIARLDAQGSAVVAGFRRLLLGEGWGSISGKVQVIVGRGEIPVTQLFPTLPKRSGADSQARSRSPSSSTAVYSLRGAIDEYTLDDAEIGPEELFDQITSDCPDTPDEWEEIDMYLDPDGYWDVIIEYFEGVRS